MTAHEARTARLRAAMCDESGCVDHDGSVVPHPAVVDRQIRTVLRWIESGRLLRLANLGPPTSTLTIATVVLLVVLANLACLLGCAYAGVEATGDVLTVIE